MRDDLENLASPFVGEALYHHEAQCDYTAPIDRLVEESPFSHCAVSEFESLEFFDDAVQHESLLCDSESQASLHPEREWSGGRAVSAEEEAALEFEVPSCDGELESDNDSLAHELVESEIWSGSAEQIAFRNRVLAAHLARSKAARGLPQQDFPDDALENVPGTDIRTLPDTATAAGRLLAAANEDLAKAKQTSDTDALRTKRLSATSGYRGSKHQRDLWIQYFSAKGGYYDRTQAPREKFADGLHSEQAVKYMLTPKKAGGFGLGGRIAAPGYSNHQGGIAIDFWQEREKGHEILNKSNDNARSKWRKTWFHQWLGKNANLFGFKPIATEEWHWEYRLRSAITTTAPPATLTRASGVTTHCTVAPGYGCTCCS